MYKSDIPRRCPLTSHCEPCNTGDYLFLARQKTAPEDPAIWRIKIRLYRSFNR